MDFRAIYALAVTLRAIPSAIDLADISRLESAFNHPTAVGFAIPV